MKSSIFRFLQKEVFIIGNSNNNLDMMEKAGFSIVMENASKQVKKATDVVTSSMTEMVWWKQSLILSCEIGKIYYWL